MAKENTNIELSLTLKAGNFLYNREYLPIIFIYENHLSEEDSHPDKATHTLIKTNNYNFTEELANRQAARDTKEIAENIQSLDSYEVKRYFVFDLLFDGGYEHFADFNARHSKVKV